MFFSLVFIACLGLGADVLYLYQRRIPRDWPLAMRPLVNNREKLVWVWLAKGQHGKSQAMAAVAEHGPAPKRQGKPALN